MIIDFHTHAFPDALAQRALDTLVAKAAQHADIYGPSRTHTDGTYSGLAASSAETGIDLSILMPIATSVKPSARLNESAAEADRFPGLRSFGSVHPMSPDALAELEHIRALGLRGIKLHPDYQDFFVDCDESIAVIKRAYELGLWVLLHAGEDIGFVPPFHCTPERIARMAEATNAADRVVLAHMGGYRLWDRALEVLPPLGLHIDTSNSVELRHDQWPVFAELVRAFGSKRVLFGSDSPWASQSAALCDTRRFLDEYGFSTEEQNDIFGNNAAKILGLMVQGDSCHA